MIRKMAARKAIAFDAIEALVGDLPGVERGTAYGTPALKVNGQMFTCVPTHKSAEPHSLAVRIDFADRDELIAHDPETFYLKDHYVDYAVVLVRLSRIHRDALRDLLHMSWRFMSTRGRRVKRARRGGVQRARRSKGPRHAK
jgi:hypothetical protein